MVVTIARDQLKRAAALTLTFSAGPPVRRGIDEVKEYISFSYVESRLEPNVGLIAGVSVGKEVDGNPHLRAIADYPLLNTLCFTFKFQRRGPVPFARYSVDHSDRERCNLQEKSRRREGTDDNQQRCWSRID